VLACLFGEVLADQPRCLDKEFRFAVYLESAHPNVDHKDMRIVEKA